MARKQFSGGAAQTTLSAGIASTDLSLSVASGGSAYPDGSVGPFVLVLGRGTPTEEKILCTARSGNNFTIDASGRGYDGTTAGSWSSGSTVNHCIDALTMTDLSGHVYDTTRHDHTQYPQITQAWTDEAVSGSTFTDLGSMTVTLVADPRNHYRWCKVGKVAYVTFNQIVSFGGTFQNSVCVKLPAALTPAYKRIPLSGFVVNVIANAGTYDQLDRVTLIRYDAANLTGGNAHLSFNGSFEVA